jgi:hypothetical protein
MGVKVNKKKIQMLQKGQGSDEKVAVISAAKSLDASDFLAESKNCSNQPPANQNQEHDTALTNRSSVISVTSETSGNSTVAETAANGKCSFFAVVGSLFSNLNCKKKGMIFNFY